MTHSLLARLEKAPRPPVDLPEDLLGETDKFYRFIARSAPSMLYLFDLVESRNLWANRSVVTALGYDPAEIQAMGDRILPDLMHPEDLARYPAHVQACVNLADGETAEFEYRMRTKSGEWRWLNSRDSPYRRDARGAVTQIFGSAMDITERKAQESAVALVACETHHRVKNVFTVVGSLISLTSRAYDDSQTSAALEVLRARVDAMSHAHAATLGRSGQSEPARLSTLLNLVLAPYAVRDHFTFRGDDPALSLHQSSALGMMFHELATNAAKYGALASGSGSISVETAQEQRGGEPWIVVLWIEDLGRADRQCATPIHRGFGSSLIENAVRQVGGEVSRDWTSEGLHLRLVFPRGPNKLQMAQSAATAV